MTAPANGRLPLPLRRIWLVAAALASMLILPVAVEAAYPCAIYKSFGASDTVTNTDLNSMQTLATQTVAGDVTCLNDYSTNTTEMQTTTDPYPGASPSLATTLAGELERLRYVIKTVLGFSQWYAHSENINFGTRTVTGAQWIFPSKGSFQTPSDGVFRLNNAADSSSGTRRLILGPADTNGAALRANLGAGPYLDLMVGDASAWAPVVAANFQAAGYAAPAIAGGFRSNGIAFADLGTPANGWITYCTDCVIANPCTGSGTGALAKRLGGAWVCN